MIVYISRLLSALSDGNIQSQKRREINTMTYTNIRLFTANGIPEALSNLWYGTDCSVVEIQDAIEDAKNAADLLRRIQKMKLLRNVSDTKNLVSDELVASAIKSANRTKIEPLAQQKLAESLNQKYGEGAVFINKVVINNMDFEEAYNTAIQQKSIAQQNADKQKIENEAAIAKAEADKQVAITNAEAEAQKTSIAADAQAEANRKIAESLSDTLIEYQKIQKWDGKLPTVSGSNALVSIDPAE